MTIFGWTYRTALALLAGWLAGPLVVLAQQPAAATEPEAPKTMVFGYFVTILAIALGLVIMLRPGTRSDPEAQ